MAGTDPSVGGALDSRFRRAIEQPPCQASFCRFSHRQAPAV